MPSIRLLKARDRWENEVKIAFEQKKMQERIYRKYDQSCIDIVARYKRWLKERDIEPQINLNLYSKLH